MGDSRRIDNNNKRIIKNSLALYVRMFFILVVSLYTSRVTLKVLGIEDYGIYNVVAGVVSLMTLLNTSMSATLQRFLNYAHGSENPVFQRKTFSAGFVVYLLLSVVFIILAETIGLWFLNTKLLIPESRIQTANIVYQFVIISVVIQFLSNPYNAVILAREKMSIYAYVSILEALLKLASIFLLLTIKGDKLVLYGLFTMAVAIIVTTTYRVYCRSKFKESIVNWRIDISLFKEILSFSGWTLFGSGSDLMKDQGINVMLNTFFSPAINASRGIACQINSIVSQFFSSFYAAVKPQIVKYYAQKDYPSLFDLINRSSRYSFYLILLVSLPLIVETPFVVKIWLGQVPEYVVVFFRLTVLSSAVDAISSPLMTSANATGRIVKYQVTLGFLKLLTIPVAYFFLKSGYNAVSVFWVTLSLTIVCFIVRIILVKELIPSFPAFSFVKESIFRTSLVTIVALFIPIVVHQLFGSSMLNSMAVIFLCIISSIASIVIIGLESKERVIVKKKIASYLK